MADIIKRESDGKTFDTSKIFAEVYDEANRRLRVDSSISLTSDINIGNVQTYSTDGTDTGTKYGKVDSDGQVYITQSTAADLNMTEANSGDIKTAVESIASEDFATQTTLSTVSSTLTTIEGDTSAIQTSVQLLDDSVGTHDSAVPTKVLLQGQYAETTVPTAVADGDVVRAWFDEYGKQVLYGANLSNSSIDTTVTNQALLNTLTVTNLSAVTATGAGTAIDMSNYNKITVQYTATSVGTGGTIKTQGSLDATNFYDLDVESITTSGTTYFSLSDQKHKYLRTNVTERTDGTYTTIVFAGN